MKKIITICAALLMTASVFAQAPEKISYQAVIRDGNNNLVSSTAVGTQISILQGSASGTALYVETQTPTSNANGLVSLEIGAGTVVSGDFTTIDWENGPYFIKTETDPTGGTSYTITGTSQLLSVPYALYAKNTDSWITEVDSVYTLKNVSIGNTSPVNLSSGIGTPAPLRIYGESQTNAAPQSRIVIDRVDPSQGGPAVQMSKINGTPGNYQPVTQGTTLGIISMGGYNGTNTTPDEGVWLQSVATENQTPTASGNKFQILTTPNGTNNNITQLIVTDTGLLHVTNNDIYISELGKGIIMKSPNGNCWRVTVDNNGNFVSAPITCP